MTENIEPVSLADRIREGVQVPEEVVSFGGCTVVVAGFTVQGRFELIEAAAGDGLDQADMYRLALGHVLNPDTRQPVFTSEEIDDLLASAHAPAVDAVVEAFSRVNGLDKGAESELGKDS